MDSFVLSVIGADRSGLVEALAEIVVEHGGSWERSQLTELAGVFAGVALVRLPADRVQDFHGAMGPLRDRGLLDVALRPAVDLLPGSAPTVDLDVVGADRPGIVRDVSHLLAELGVGIVDLRTWTESAAIAGGELFRATAVLRLPDGVTQADLTAALEGLPDNLMVDLVEV
jgi:glycine cleavage system regulatory protein